MFFPPILQKPHTPKTLSPSLSRCFIIFVADIYSRALWYSVLDPNTSIEEKQSTLCEYNKYLLSLSLSTHLRWCIISLDWGNLTFSRTSSNVDSHQPAHMAAVDSDLINIAKLRSACHLMVELKMSTTSHTPSSPEADNAFFSSLAFGIEFLQQLFQRWSMFDQSSQYVGATMN